jgi:hypothetical protein
VPGLCELLDWTCGCVCLEQEPVFVSSGVDLLCSAAIGSGESFPWSACVCLPVWFRALIWNCLLWHTVVHSSPATAAEECSDMLRKRWHVVIY